MKAFPENSPCLPFHVHASRKTLIFNLNVLSVLLIILGWLFIIHHLRLWKEFPKPPPVPWLHCSPPTAFSHTATTNTHFFPWLSVKIKVGLPGWPSLYQISFSDFTVLFSSAQPNAKWQIKKHTTLQEPYAFSKGIFL